MVRKKSKDGILLLFQDFDGYKKDKRTGTAIMFTDTKTGEIGYATSEKHGEETIRKVWEEIERLGEFYHEDLMPIMKKYGLKKHKVRSET